MLEDRMFFRKRKQIDLGLGSNFKERKSLPTRLHELLVTIIGNVISGASAFAGVTLPMLVSFVLQVVSIGLSIYNMTRSQGGKRGGGLSGGGTTAPMAIDSNGQLVNTRQASDPVRVIYGKVKSGGTWVFSKTSSAANNILNVIVTWGEGELGGLGTGIDSALLYSGTTLDDLETKGEFVYAGCACDMACYSYVPCSCNMVCYVYA